MRCCYSLLFFFIGLNSSFCQSGFHLKNDLKKVVIPFQMVNNLIFIPIDVNGETLTFLLDTGVEETVLFSLADKEEVSLHQLEKIKLRGLGTDEAVVAYKSSKNIVETAGFIDENHELFLILDQEFNFSSQVGIPVNGIIGYHFFKNHLVEINYDQKKVIVYAETHSKIRKKLQKSYQREPISLENNKPYFITNLINTEQLRPCKMLIDTGNSDAVWLFLSQTKELQLPSKNISCFLGRGFSGNVYGQKARIRQFTFGNTTFQNPIGTFPDSTSLRGVNFVENRVGSLGGEVLSRFSVVFDYPNSHIFSKPNAKIKAPFQFNMSGLEVEHDGLEWVTQTYQEHNGSAAVYTAKQGNTGHVQDNLKIKFELKPVFRIFNVREGSPAQLAGLQTGDRIISLNGKNAHYLSIEKINELLKSEDGRSILITVERKGKPFTYKFQLKSIL